MFSLEVVVLHKSTVGILSTYTDVYCRLVHLYNFLQVVQINLSIIESEIPLTSVSTFFVFIIVIIADRI